MIILQNDVRTALALFWTKKVEKLPDPIFVKFYGMCGFLDGSFIIAAREFVY